MLQKALLTCINMAAQAHIIFSGPGLSGHGIPVQKIKPPLAFYYQTRADRHGLAAPGGNNPRTPSEIKKKACRDSNRRKYPSGYFNCKCGGMSWDLMSVQGYGKPNRKTKMNIPSVSYMLQMYIYPRQSPGVFRHFSLLERLCRGRHFIFSRTLIIHFVKSLQAGSVSSFHAWISGSRTYGPHPCRRGIRFPL